MANTKMTPEKKAKFLAGLADCSNVTRAAETAGVNRVSMYQLRAKDKKFAKQWDESAAIGAARLEDEARRRAVEGWEEPVFYQGGQCATVRKFSDTLLICLLKAHHPEKYADRNKTEGTLNGNLVVTWQDSNT